jgi:hypothetical protein
MTDDASPSGRTVVFVEGESDRVAVEVLARRLGVTHVEVIPVGGSKGIRRALALVSAGPDGGATSAVRARGLVDAHERRDFERFLDAVQVCDPDLERELFRALGVDGVERLIAAEGELDSFRRLQRQPAQRTRTEEQQLARFIGGRSGNKLRYARLMAEAVPLPDIPPPIRALLAA